MSTFFNEAEADAVVLTNIAKYKRQLLIIKELDKMHLYKTEDGKILKVISFEEVDRAELVEIKDKAEASFKEAVQALVDFDHLSSGLQVEDRVEITVTEETETPAPAAEAPTPAPEPQAPPAGPTQQVNPPAPAPIVLN